MACEVYANGNDIACKVASGQTIAAMPDVCLSPPSPPAGPIPIPYPNTAMASDTTEGSKTVQIGGDEVMLKNKSYFKTSNGDEAATKSLGMGVVTHQIQGKVSFLAWSMDVKFEGENVPRHLDITGHNEMSDPPNCPPWPYTDQMAISLDHPCVGDMKKAQAACKDYQPDNKDGPDCCEAAGLTGSPLQFGKKFDMEAAMPSGIAENRQAVLAASDRANANECLRAKRCELQPWDREKTGCCPAQTPHHLIEASAILFNRKGSMPLAATQGAEQRYRAGNAPCVCVEGCTNTVGTHGFMHTLQSTMNAGAPEESLDFMVNGKATPQKVQAQTYAEAKENANKAMQKTFPLSGCNKDCIDAQLNQYHNKCGIDDDTKIQAVTCGSTEAANVEFAEQNSLERAMNDSPYFNPTSEGPGAPDVDFGGMGSGWTPSS